jgi:hypothetical protein
MKNKLLIFFALFSISFANEVVVDEKMPLTIGKTQKENKAKTATIIALDKITTKRKKLIMEIGETKTFGRITIESLFCWKSLPSEPSENKVLLKIEEKNEELFYGWMFSSSPSINPFEHALYDVFVVDCAI